MAKVGPEQRGGYDPFNAISSSLAQLTEPPVEPAPRPAAQVSPSPVTAALAPSPAPRPAPAPPAAAPSVSRPMPRAPVAVPARAPQPAQERRAFPVREPDVDDRFEALPDERHRTDEDDEFVGSGEEESASAFRGPRGVHPDNALRTTKRFKTTKSEGLRHDKAAVRLAARLGISIDFSKVTRALWEIYLRHEEDILKQIQPDGTWERPANNDAVGLAELDDRLAEVIWEGLRVGGMRPKNRR